MPLFSHKHDGGHANNDPILAGQNNAGAPGVNNNQTGGLFGHHHGNGTGAGYKDTTGGPTGTHHGTGAGTGMGSGLAGVGAGDHTVHHHHNDPMYPSPNAPGAGAAMTAGAGNVLTGTDRHGNPTHPSGGVHSGGSGGKSLTGKIEHAVGTMIGSQNLKAKGIAKEQEAAALKAQGAELGEAERLEAEALARRERAVAHGAHPDHKHLGGHNPGAGAANVNELGGGAGYGVAGAGGAGSAARGGY